MKPTSRLSIVAALVAALCLAPAAFAKPKDDQQVPGEPGKPGKAGKKGKAGGQAAPGGAPAAPAGPQAPAPGGSHRRGPGGPGIVIVPPVPPPPPYYRRGHRVYSDYADSNIAAVQRALKRQGYYAGPVDGDAGSGTRAAIRGFRADHGLPPSSGIDGPLLRALGL